MKVLLISLLLGFISLIVVCVSGVSSGVVRLTTLALRAIFAFAMTSAASFFLIMLFDYFEEMREKKLKKELEQVAESTVTEGKPVENVENSAPVEEQPPQPENVFQPMTAENLPNIEK